MELLIPQVASLASTLSLGGPDFPVTHKMPQVLPRHPLLHTDPATQSTEGPWKSQGGPRAALCLVLALECLYQHRGYEEGCHACPSSDKPGGGLPRQV